MAIVDRYCVPGGAGAADGTSWADAWSYAQALANAPQFSRVNISDEGTPFAISAAATQVNNSINFVGWNAAKSAVATAFADQPVIDYAGLASGNAIDGNAFTTWDFVHFKNAPAYVYADTAADGCSFMFCQFTDCVQTYSLDDTARMLFCKVVGTSGNNAIDADNNHIVFGNDIIAS
jgi:hypothetical protein